MVKNYKHMDEGAEEGGLIEKKSHDKEVTWSIRLEHMEDLDVFEFTCLGNASQRCISNVGTRN
jgi:hypothetical protein